MNRKIKQKRYYPIEHSTDDIRYWKGRVDLAELLLMWIHTGVKK